MFEVWSLSNDWWATKDGTLEADNIDEHWVYPSLAKY